MSGEYDGDRRRLLDALDDMLRALRGLDALDDMLRALRGLTDAAQDFLKAIDDARDVYQAGYDNGVVSMMEIDAE